jgi:hypothetical protein
VAQKSYARIIGADLIAMVRSHDYAILIVSATHTVNPSLRRGMPFDVMAVSQVPYLAGWLVG